MLEESRMEKKSLNRSSQSQSRPSAIDCKKNTESTHKPWLRNYKKREGPNNAPKNEPYRKNVPAQRGREPVDRRPRARGPSGLLLGGTQSTGIEEDEEPEIGSVFVPGSKKQNLNHLLNFMYPTRGGQERRSTQPQLRRPFHHQVSYRYDRDFYHRANCQIVVKEDGDYKVNLADPDVPVKWEQIEEIVVRSAGRSECPICLGTPVAGRVGPCGHVYCWACILHYAAAHEKQPPPCPVCIIALVHVKEMKPARMVQWEAPAEEVTMRLVRRLRGSTVVEIAPPRGQVEESTSETPIQPLENINIAPYSKFFGASKQQVHEILNRERIEIQKQILEEIDISEVVYLEQALEMLKLKEDKLNTLTEKVILTEILPENAVPIVFETQEINENKVDWFDVTEEGAACIDSIQNKMEELGVGHSKLGLNPDAPIFVQTDVIENSEQFPLVEDIAEPEETDLPVTDIDKENQARYFYFYQADDGQLVFLNSLNVSILKASWGTLAAAPPTIRGRILHRETVPLTEESRKHRPYTTHLPLHCSFDIVELDLQPPHVTTAALNNFTAKLERSARIRARQERDEKRREKAYRRAMEGPPKPDFSSEVLFPPAAPVLSPPIDIPPLPSSFEASPSTSATSPPSSGPSFAKMASASGTWRVRKVAPPPPPPAEPVDGETLGPRAVSLSDAIEAALLAPSTSGKKKKSKQKVLFTMGMQRSA